MGSEKTPPFTTALPLGATSLKPYTEIVLRGRDVLDHCSLHPFTLYLECTLTAVRASWEIALAVVTLYTRTAT